MSMKIEIGENEVGEMLCYDYLPYESRGIMISAVTRSGKTTLVFELVKRFKNCEIKPQIVMISKAGDECRLRDEIDFIIIGNHGDIPIDVNYARILGENVRKEGYDVIIDITSLKTEKEQDEFVSDFFIGLQLDDQQKYWKKPCVVFYDEVQLACNSSKGSRSRDIISTMAQTCLKKNILPIFVSHSLRDVYARCRDELVNHIIGYIDNPRQRDFACEVLNLPSSESDTINNFREVRGKFYVEGVDISIPAKVIRVKPSKIYPKGELIIPPISEQGSKLVEELRMSLSDIPVSQETQMKNQLQKLNAQNYRLSLNQMSEDNKQRIFQMGVTDGWKQSAENCRNVINDVKNRLGKKSLFHKPVDIIVKTVIENGKEFLTVE